MTIDPRLTTPHADDAISLQELEIYHGLMGVRTAAGLPEVPLSASLSTTTNRHLVDQFDVFGGRYKGHAWSDPTINADPLKAATLLTGFSGNSYEIASGAEPALTPSYAVRLWRTSTKGHYEVIVEQASPTAAGIDFTTFDWLGVGVALRNNGSIGISDAMFAEVADPAGPPTIVGTMGNDIAVLTSFGDTAIAYEGNDTLSGAGGNDILYGNQGEDALFGDAGNDTLFGGQGADLVFGGDGSDALYGNMMNDVIYGATGGDSVFGGQGDDALYGEAGNDVLAGNLGNDTLNGGAGADTFAFGGNSGADVVADFSAADGDRLSFSGQTWTLGSAADGSALLTLSGGGTVTLAGIAPAAFNTGWITA